MNANPEEIAQAVESQKDMTAEAVAQAIKSAARHHRKASVTVTYTAKHDKESPHVLVVSSTIKVKEPKGQRIDITGTSEPAELLRLDTEEADGQQKIDH
jgi:hypothetical protein